MLVYFILSDSMLCFCI